MTIPERSDTDAASPAQCNAGKQRLTYWLLYTNIDRTLVNSLHGLLNCEKGRLDCHVIKTEYRTRVRCIHM